MERGTIPVHRLCHCLGHKYDVQPVDRFVTNAGFDIQLISLALCIQSLPSSFEPKSCSIKSREYFSIFTLCERMFILYHCIMLSFLVSKTKRNSVVEFEQFGVEMLYPLRARIACWDCSGLSAKADGASPSSPGLFNAIY
jgi:hypothetical protein